jgi:diguanylate cyclase (GGDEF)-like protein
VSDIDPYAGSRGGWSPVPDGQHRPAGEEPGFEPGDGHEQYDTLTGLPQRSLFIAHTEAALRCDPDALAVLVVGVDRFKEINYTLGHRIGDRLLREVAARLASHGSTRTCLARLGGDEFALLCLDARDTAAPLEVANELRARLDAPIVIEGIPLNVEASIGIARGSDDCHGVEELLRRADVALTHAKARGGGVELYEPRYDTFDLTRFRLVSDFRAALTGGDLVLHYQPKLDLATRRVVGAEALLRWEHPERGLIPPLDFIPLIERTALIDSLTHHVIDEALRQLADWRRLGLDLHVAVNLAARNLLDAGLPQEVDDLLRRHDVPADLLVLEVTERGVMVDPERAALVLAEVRALGAGVSIDDFGTGHASLAYLARLPATELKIDRSFVSSACGDPQADAIVRAISDLGRRFGLSVVAEGIETDEAMEHFMRIGCAVGQGYRISRPLPAAAITARLKGGLEHARGGDPDPQPGSSPPLEVL